MSNALIALGHAMRGYVPAAMGIDRQQENKRRYDQTDARAAEEHDMRKQSFAQQMAATGLQTAKMQRELDDDAKLREHLIAWRDGRQRIQDGDLNDFEAGLREYNAGQGWAADGFTMKPRLTDDGSATILDRYDASGKLIESSPPLTRGEVLKLYDTGMAEKMKWLNPKRYDQAVAGVAARQAGVAARQAKLEDRVSRERIAAGNNATTLEVARINQGAADRRHTGTLAVQRDRLEFDKSNPGGGLTPEQQRQNEEILAAREAVAGLTPEEIKSRTDNATLTGRPNPNFDPDMARNASLARRRLIGDDPTFDQRRTRQSAGTKRTPLQAAQAALDADPNMKGMRLGNQTMRGFEVFDADGKLVGHFGKAK